MSIIALHEGDNRITLRRLIDQGVRVHAVCADPPYGLVATTKRFGKKNAAPAKFGTDGAFQRAGAGFMGSKWDGTGIERDPEFWALIFEILLPGGYCVVFSGASTFDLQTYAMRQAGFIIHPMTGWVFGSGMPKDHDAAKAIDKTLGVKGEVVPKGAAVRRVIPGAQQHSTGDWTKGDDRVFQPGDYIPASPEAEQWQGWGYGLQSQKPALEPICIAQKPFSEKNGPLNIMKHGVGAMNLDACRVPVDPAADAKQLRNMERSKRAADDGWGFDETPGATVVSPLGRHPANLIHDGSDEVRALFPDSNGQQGDLKGTEPSRTGQEGTACYGEYGARPATPKRQDTDTSAARFFNAFPLDAESLYYHAKASKRDRIYECRTCGNHAIGVKPTCTCAPNIRTHPTVKPIGLMEHLVKLVTPPGGTVLDCFAGTGTTGRAAQNLGFNAILLEADPDFCRDIRLRCQIGDEINTALTVVQTPDTQCLQDLIGGVSTENLQELIG